MLNDSTLLLLFFSALVAGNLFAYCQVAFVSKTALGHCETREDVHGARALRVLTNFAAGLLLTAVAVESLVVLSVGAEAHDSNQLFFGALLVCAAHVVYSLAICFLMGNVVRNAHENKQTPGVWPQNEGR